jgi:hypothetical protein
MEMIMRSISLIENSLSILEFFMLIGTDVVHCTLSDTQMFYQSSAGFYLANAPGKRFLDSNRSRLFVSSGLRRKFYRAT